MSPAPVTTFWRIAGMSYLQVRTLYGEAEGTEAKKRKKPIGLRMHLWPIDRSRTDSNSIASRIIQRLTLRHQYINRASTSVRGALKEPAKRKAMQNEVFSYKASTWTAGEQGPKTEITTL